MKKIKVVSIMRGISKKSGKPYTRLVLKGIREDGTSCVSDFFITENVYDFYNFIFKNRRMRQQGVKKFNIFFL